MMSLGVILKTQTARLILWNIMLKVMEASMGITIMLIYMNLKRVVRIRLLQRFQMVVIAEKLERKGVKLEGVVGG